MLLSTSHNWPGVSCSPLPQGLLLPLQLMLKDLAVRQQRCPGQQAFHVSNAAREYQQVVTVNGQERACTSFNFDCSIRTVKEAHQRVPENIMA